MAGIYIPLEKYFPILFLFKNFSQYFLMSSEIFEILEVERSKSNFQPEEERKLRREIKLLESNVAVLLQQNTNLKERIKKLMGKITHLSEKSIESAVLFLEMSKKISLLEDEKKQANQTVQELTQKIKASLPQKKESMIFDHIIEEKIQEHFDKDEEKKVKKHRSLDPNRNAKQFADLNMTEEDFELFLEKKMSAKKSDESIESRIQTYLYNILIVEESKQRMKKNQLQKLYNLEKERLKKYIDSINIGFSESQIQNNQKWFITRFIGQMFKAENISK